MARVHKEIKDRKDLGHKVIKVQPAHRETRVQSEVQAHKVIKAQRGQLEAQVHKVIKARKGTKGHKATKDRRVT